jgi:hypothetical protein
MQKSKHKEHELLVVQVRRRWEEERWREVERGGERGREGERGGEREREGDGGRGKGGRHHENIQSVIIESTQCTAGAVM